MFFIVEEKQLQIDLFFHENDFQEKGSKEEKAGKNQKNIKFCFNVLIFPLFSQILSQKNIYLKILRELIHNKNNILEYFQQLSDNNNRRHQISRTHYLKQKNMKKVSVNESKAKHTFTAHGVPIHMPYEPYEGQKLFIEYVINCLNSKTNALIQSPTGTGKTLSLLCSTLSWLKNRQQINKNPSQLNRRIIYTSRTHSQLKQIVQQIVRSGFEVKLSILASRDHTCLNKDLKELTGKSKELECRLRTIKKDGLFCKYFHNEEYFSKMSSIGQIVDLEDLGLKGQAEGFCPFFYQKTSKNIANLILMPYNYLFDPPEDITNIVKDSILIFDEGHNIPSVCQETQQQWITASTLAKALNQLADLRELNLNQRKNIFKQSQQQNQIKAMMKTTAQELQMHASYVTLIHAHIQTLALPNADGENGLIMSSAQFLECLDEGTKDGEFGSIHKQIGKLVTSGICLKSDILFKPFWAVDSWIGFLHKIFEIYQQKQQRKKQNISRIQPEGIIPNASNTGSDCYRCQVCYQGSDIKLTFICLDPKAGFQKIVKLAPYSIILTSGTLSPLNSFPLELQVEFNKPLPCPHILSKQQVNGCVLTQGPNKIRLNFSYENRENKEVYKQLGVVLEDIATITDNGVIAFVSSYKMLEKIKIQLTDSGHLSKIYAKKAVFFEKKNSADFKSTLQQYLKQSQKPKGALLFALARGKISQGLDFSGEKCRAVVLIGVPYPAAKDPKIIAKMAYLDQKSKLQKSMNGSQWYICETIRCINQAIGRIVRNRTDYGSIYLLDQRFKKGQIMQQISSWARDCIKIVSEYEQFMFKAQVFRKYHDERNRDQFDADNFFKSARGSLLLGNKIDPNLKLVKGSISLSRANPTLGNTTLPLPNTSQPQPSASKGNIQTAVRADPSQMMKDLRQKYKVQITQQKQKQEASKPSREKIIFGNRNSKKLPQVELQQCPVCRLQRKLIRNSECTHELCEDCWDIWLKKDLRCPICRVRVRQKYLIRQ